MKALTDGIVMRWSDEDGWGVLRSDDVPGDIWVHFSAIQANGYRSLTQGSRVRFSWEQARQDEFDYRALEVFGDSESAPPQPSSSAAFQSDAVIRFDS